MLLFYEMIQCNVSSPNISIVQLFGGRWGMGECHIPQKNDFCKAKMFNPNCGLLYNLEVMLLYRYPLT
jgi:hypothetical protein